MEKIFYNTEGYSRQANGSCWAKWGDTVVLAVAVRSNAAQKFGFLPLTVDYLERNYAVGKIPGGFFRREGKLTERETLVSRLIDRSLRPLFPKQYFFDTQVTCMVLSADENNSADILAVNAASVALLASDIPFSVPVGCVRLCRVDGKFVVNPTLEEQKSATLNLVVSGTESEIVMIEGEAKEESESVIVEGIFFAHDFIKQICSEQMPYLNSEKLQVEEIDLPEETKKELENLISEDLNIALRTPSKTERKKKLAEAQEKLMTACMDQGVDLNLAESFFFQLLKRLTRNMIFAEGRRIDGRGVDDMRELDLKVSILPRTHGSAMFRRGETQAIVVTTLGTLQEAQKLDYVLGEEVSKRFMLHYNFPGFSVGELKPLRSPSRREIGHGNLAERALKNVLASEDSFPYAIRIVSEILESNGSSSMATVCGGSLSLMDAGVPITDHVAGVAMGLIKEGDRYEILTDILGDEDHLGDMDFKVCGTHRGVTAVQMDVKLDGLVKELFIKAMEKARNARLRILEAMRLVINSPKEISKLAPKIKTVQIDPSKIGLLIGTKGERIKSIIEAFDVKIDISESGEVRVYGGSSSQIDRAIEYIKDLTFTIQPGQIFEATVKKITPFGLIVGLQNGSAAGLVHVSEMDSNLAKNFDSKFKEGDIIKVKVLDAADKTKLKLSLKL
jgi:polyribonucleotide nucleotidyltransferase